MQEAFQLQAQVLKTWGGLGWEGQKARKVPIRRIQHSARRRIRAIAENATHAERAMAMLLDHEREMHQAKIKLIYLRTLDML
jgi:hypothetical protein